MNYSERVELINLLIALCLIDNEFHENELELMKKISTWLGINPKDFQSMHSIHIPDNDWAYKVLEVSPTATNDELKKAYRRMAVKYHPDKVAHLDSSVVNAANEKFKVLNEAWEKIKEERNIT
jgi:DnaJ like chaperone protein